MAILQEQLSNGRWVDVPPEHAELYLGAAERFNGIDTNGKFAPRFRSVRPVTRDEITAALMAGQTLSHDWDWYSKLRVKLAASHATPHQPTGRLLACGHVVAVSNLIMTTANGSSCPDCYDRMNGAT